MGMGPGMPNSCGESSSSSISAGEEDGGGSRNKRALSKSEADALMNVWTHDKRPVTVRNTALLRLMDWLEADGISDAALGGY